MSVKFVVEIPLHEVASNIPEDVVHNLLAVATRVLADRHKGFTDFKLAADSGIDMVSYGVQRESSNK